MPERLRKVLEAERAARRMMEAAEERAKALEAEARSKAEERLKAVESELEGLGARVAEEARAAAEARRGELRAALDRRVRSWRERLEERRASITDWAVDAVLGVEAVEGGGTRRSRSRSSRPAGGAR